MVIIIIILIGAVFNLQVTMSTVGFGDISAITYFGRTFMIIFISIGLVSEVLGFLLTV